MAVKRYDGSQWVTVAGKGDQGTSSSIATWVKTATGGETSVSGNDDNSQPLSYTVGQELVFINGSLQKRGADYTATTGNSITGLTALAANDVVTVWTVNAFSVTNAISNTLVDAKGDLIVATGADTPGRLAVGSNNQVLTVDSTTGTGLKWATPAAGGKVLQVVSSVINTGYSQTAETYTDVTGFSASITPTSSSSKVLVVFQVSSRVSRAGDQVYSYGQIVRGSTAIYEGFVHGINLGGNTQNYDNFSNQVMVYLDSPATTSSTTYKLQISRAGGAGTIYVNNTNADSSITLIEIGA